MDATNSSATNAAADSTNISFDNEASIVDAPSYDEPYRYGRRPNSRAPFPFTEREFARLLIVRGRIHGQQAAFNPSEA